MAFIGSLFHHNGKIGFATIVACRASSVDIIVTHTGHYIHLGQVGGEDHAIPATRPTERSSGGAEDEFILSISIYNGVL